MEIITSLAQKTEEGWNSVPIGTYTDRIFRTTTNDTTQSLSQILEDIETRLLNIETCLKEVSQTQDDGYEQP